MKIAKRKLIFLILTLIYFCFGCDNSDSSSNNASSPPIWIAYESNPIIQMGDQLANAQWNDPSVLKERATYVMYLTANQGEIGKNVVPFYATSNDGINWDINTTPLLSSGSNVDDFDYAKIETPSVVIFANKYHMYYTGVKTDLSGRLSIGHAVSNDGINWTKDPNNPIVEPTDDWSDWNGAQVAEPGAVVYDNKIYLYYTAVGIRPEEGPTAKRTIGLSISNGGYTFETHRMVLEQSSTYLALDGYGGYSTPSALIINNKFHLFYDVVHETNFVQVALHHAVSNDGISWIEDAQAIFTRSEFNWTSREIRSPCVIHDENKLKMWFAGDNYLASGIWGIGYATVDENIYK